MTECKFQVGDEVKLSEKAVKYFSRDNWTKYYVPHCMYLGDFGTVTHLRETQDKTEIYVKNGAGCVFYYEDDLEFVQTTGHEVELPTEVNSALDVQVGGSHYKDKGIQPVEYAFRNNLGFLEANVVKYVSRHQDKAGADDIRKAIHYCKFILEFKYGIKE